MSGIEPVAGNVSRRNMTQTLEFRVRLPGGLQDVAEIMSCMQLSRLIVRTSLVVQWLRICLPMQETQVQSLIQKPRSHMPQGPTWSLLVLELEGCDWREALMLQRKISHAATKTLTQPNK